MEHTKDPSKDNVILIGMPGVGKSTAGVILAKVLGYDFLDSDLVIQKQTKKTPERNHCRRGHRRIQRFGKSHQQ